MAYSRPPPLLGGRPPSNPTSERPRPLWDSHYHPAGPSPTSQQHPSLLRHTGSSLSAFDSMDPESSDSDVSVTIGEPYGFNTPLKQPASLPPAPSKHSLESSDGVQARLKELSRVEDHNIKKQELLLAKRRRKDEKIQRKREAQDRKWNAIVAARDRRDARIKARREKEDAAFKKFDDQLEEEETSLRRRLKRLKRGLPPDESPPPGTRSISSTSMSPPGPAYSTIPPPAKRHQTGPPGQSDVPATSQPRPPNGISTPNQNPAPPAPQYSFYQSNSQAYSSYQPPSYSNTPVSGPPATSNSPYTSNNTPSERSRPVINGHPTSPLAKPGQPGTPNQTLPPFNDNNKSRPASSSYDTRPPPTTTSGFASVNMPPTSGFAPINPRATATPPNPQPGAVRFTDSAPNRTPGSAQGSDYHFSNRSYPPFSTPSTGIPYGPASTKRAPSTTHPYQMSEAFANRHHHCERVDSMNRGIWTSYGVGGTQDEPTGPPVEMYLRCNHDDCRRIDWRTVHGLQCHIVKNHEMPKGTIASLEKALEKYGVPVKEIEDYEREHGEGTAGTSADPKNFKIKNKTREASAAKPPSRTGTPLSQTIDPNARPAGFKPSPTISNPSPSLAQSQTKSPVVLSTPNGLNSNANGIAVARSDAQKFDKPQPLYSPQSANLNNHAGTQPYQTPSKLGPEDKKLQGDVEMSEAPPLHSNSTAKPSLETRDNSKPWFSGFMSANKSFMPPAATKQSPVSDSSKPISNGITASSVPTPVTNTAFSPNQEAKPTQHTPSQAIQKILDGPPNATQQAPVSLSNGIPKESLQSSVAAPSTDNKPDLENEKKDEPQINGHATQSEKKEADLHNPDDKAPDMLTEKKDDDSKSSLKAVEIEKDTTIKDSTIATTTGPSSRKNTMQSPVMTNKPINPPSSGKRMSRRSSVAQKTLADEEADAKTVDAEKPTPDNDKDEDSITVANTDNKKDEPATRDAKTPPRRAAAVRSLRKTRAG